MNQPSDLISVAIDAGLTLRNMLPVNLLWEVAAFRDSELLAQDSSSSRNKLRRPTDSLMSDDCQLASGAGVDVLAISPTLVDTRARFRCHLGQEWSSWACLGPSPIEKPVDKYPSALIQPLPRIAGGDEYPKGKNGLVHSTSPVKYVLHRVLLPDSIVATRIRNSYHTAGECSSTGRIRDSVNHWGANSAKVGQSTGERQFALLWV
jgi:hypothetical protein